MSTLPAVVVGEEYGYRQPPFEWLQPVRHALVVKLGPATSAGKVLVRWLDGEWKGLEEWVPKRRLVCRWTQAPAFLEEERCLLAAIDASRDVTGTPDHLAAEEVLDTVSARLFAPDYLHVSFGWHAYDGHVLYWGDFPTSATKLGLDPAEWRGKPLAYVDRDGALRAPFAVALDLARTLCQRFAACVLQGVREREDELRRRIATEHYEPTQEPWIKNRIVPPTAQEELTRYEPAFRLIREWCGQDFATQFDQVRDLQAELTRLREVVRRTAIRLFRQEERHEARRLLSEIGEEFPRRAAQLAEFLGDVLPPSSPTRTDDNSVGDVPPARARFGRRWD